MNTRERLQERLQQCRRDQSQASERAAEAGRLYAERRLAQLDAAFPRHGFGWRMPTAWQPGLLIVPAIRGWHSVTRALEPLRARCGSIRLYKLAVVGEDLDVTAKVITREFGKPLADALSPRLRAWNVVLDALPAQPIDAVTRGASGDVEVTTLARRMHRSGGCGYL